jgi:ParB family chromosome partitioning protein
MSDPTVQNANLKKGRLGRGLGSLLGGGMEASQNGSGAASAELASLPAAPASSNPISSVAAVAAPVAEFANGAVPPQTSAAIASVIAAPTAAQPPKIDEEAQIWKIPIDRLRANTQQPRQVFLPEALKDLTASIKEKGILQPIVARRIDERTFEIIAGERRWRAAQGAGLHEVPVILKKVSEQDSLELAIIENIQRENLNPLEEAEAYDRLMSDYHLTQQMVADKVGKERATVANALRLLLLPREVKELLKRGEISPGHAKAILSIENPIDQIAIAKRTVSDKLSVRATEKLVARAKVLLLDKGAPGGKSERPEVTKRLVESLASDLQKALGTKVTIDYADAKGKLNLHFYSDDELTSLVDKIRTACTK